jgi:hypothetical protein
MLACSLSAANVGKYLCPENRLFLTSSSQEVLGDGQEREVIHRYRAGLKAGELYFVLESGGGQSVHPPVEFIARRAAGG